MPPKTHTRKYFNQVYYLLYTIRERRREATHKKWKAEKIYWIYMEIWHSDLVGNIVRIYEKYVDIFCTGTAVIRIYNCDEIRRVCSIVVYKYSSTHRAKHNERWANARGVCVFLKRQRWSYRKVFCSGEKLSIYGTQVCCFRFEWIVNPILWARCVQNVRIIKYKF